HGENGLLVREGDVDGLVEAIRLLSRDGELRHRMGQRAAADATAFTYEAVSKSRAAILREILAARSL
ncbi:MAG: hypothetical protein ABWY36_04115, partial [Leifsonia sp.]